MERIPEPELMEDPAQAEAYATSDFSEPHNAFVDRFKRLFPDFTEGIVVDLGCGNADPTIRFARACPKVKLVGLDGSEAMLKFGRKAVEAARLSDRIQLERKALPHHGYSQPSFDAVISNSLLHQLHNPDILWQSVKELAKTGVPVFVMDLTRPPTKRRAQELVTLHAKEAPKLMARDFYNSLLAAFKPSEVGAQLDKAGLSSLKVEVVSDRHIIIYGRR